jgi:hypothetical protein
MTQDENGSVGDKLPIKREDVKPKEFSLTCALTLLS